MPFLEVLVASLGAAFLLTVVGLHKHPRIHAVSALVYAAVLLLGLGQPSSMRTAILALATAYAACWLAERVNHRDDSDDSPTTGVSKLRSHVPRL